MTGTRSVRFRQNVRVPMRDGTALSTDLYLPEGDGPFPVMVSRTPYDNTLPWLVEKGRRLADAGYAVAIQDVRGRFDSEGAYEPFRDEGPDGVDTVAWLAAQPWSTGSVGMFGRSYSGWTQWTTAAHGAPALKAIAPRVMATDLHRGLVWRGGAFNLGVLLTWGLNTSGRSMQELAPIDWVEAFRSLPLRDTADAAAQDLPFWRDWMAHPAKDAYWDAVDYERRHAEMDVPALVMGGWYDLYADDVFRQFAALRNTDGPARHSQVIVGPWPHLLSASTTTGSLDFGGRSMLDLESAELRFMDRWLRDERNGAEDDPPVRLFVMGSNRWREADAWPLPNTDWQRWHLHSGGGANTLAGDGTLGRQAPTTDEPADDFTYDPAHPVPTNGGGNCCTPELVPWGPYDQRDLEMRTDVLCYTSGPLTEDLEVIGPIRLELWAATDAPDTDWTGKLVDVWPSGRAINLCDGILRARFRDGPREEHPVTPGEPQRYEIDLMVTGITFRAGHRIRLEVSSSNFPRFDRNPNTGAPIGTSADTRKARQTVLHDAGHPSALLLPVIPA